MSEDYARKPKPSPPNTDNDEFLVRQLLNEDQEDASRKLADQLHQKEVVGNMLMQSLMQGVGGGGNNMPMNQDAIYEMNAQQTDEHRRNCEGPPTVPWTEETYSCGTKQRTRKNPYGWDESRPMVSCTNEECREQLVQLGSPRPPPGTLCANPQNDYLIRFLCSWRQHVVNTKMSSLAPGKTKWSTHSICTSEQTWLGRGTAKGGVIGHVSRAPNLINNVATFLALGEGEEEDEGEEDENEEKGKKKKKTKPRTATSAGFAMLVHLKFKWEGGTMGALSLDSFRRKLNTLKESAPKRLARLGPAAVAAGGVANRALTGLDTFQHSSWYQAVSDMLAQRQVHPRERHAILGRAHLP